MAPILILFYFGLAEATQVMMAERKAIRTASAIGDLIAQNSAITPANLDDILEMSEILMTPFPVPADRLKVCVFSIEADASNVKTVGWSRAKNSAPCPAKGSPVSNTDVPADLIAANQSLIKAKVTYTYIGPTNTVIKTNPTFNKQFYLRPRKSHKVICQGC